jgi:TRAP-type mannitol/chloroaromatic compound transport system substrate-binding protein
VLELTVNKAAWEGLDAQLQKAIETAASATDAWMLNQFEAKNLEALQRLKNEHKVQVFPFPDDVMAALKDMSEEVYEEEAAKDADFKRIYETYKAFAADNDAWSELSEAAYQRARKQ